MKIPYYLLIFLSLLAISGGLVYRLYSLDNLGVAVSLILAIIVFIIIYRAGRKYNTQSNPNFKFQISNEIQNSKYKTLILLYLFYLLLVFFCFYILLTHRTDAAIISPWQVVPGYFFAFYGLATAILVILTLRHKTTPYTLHPAFLISLHYFLSFSVALIIYKIGYGFDPFIHRATVGLIDKIGAVDPKPFYYLGQYALVEIIHKVTALPINWLDKLLVPVLAAFSLPLALWQAMKKIFDNHKAVLLTVLIILALPFSFFIVTTPQNLAYLFLLLVIILGLTCKNIHELVVIFIMALAALIIHPIAGIPAVLFVALLTVYRYKKESDSQLGVGLLNTHLKKYLYLLIFILSAIILPAVFYFLNTSSTTPPVAWSLRNILPSLHFATPNQENFILNFIYLYGFNLKMVIGLIVLAGLIIAFRARQKYKIFFAYLLMAAALGLSYLLTKLLPFDFLVSYERENYSDRIILMSAFFLLPFILLTIYTFINKILKQPMGVKIIFLTFLTFLITASLYLSYPRFDRYFNSRGYSTSANDISAVRWIEENHKQDYIVLANQQVSAAALREFGFKKYYDVPLIKEVGGIEKNKSKIKNQKSKMFYYPLPTGGPLYQYYLDMVYKKPSRQTMLAAMDLVSVNEGYFVLNKYWWAFPKLLEEAKLEADSWEKIGNEEVYVFTYKK